MTDLGFSDEEMAEVQAEVRLATILACTAGIGAGATGGRK